MTTLPKALIIIKLHTLSMYTWYMNVGINSILMTYNIDHSPTHHSPLPFLTSPIRPPSHSSLLPFLTSPIPHFSHSSHLPFLTSSSSLLMMGNLIILSSFSPNSIPVVTAATGSSSHGVKRSSFRFKNRTGTCSSIPGTICLEGRGRQGAKVVR